MISGQAGAHSKQRHIVFPCWTGEILQGGQGSHPPFLDRKNSNNNFSERGAAWNSSFGSCISNIALGSFLICSCSEIIRTVDVILEATTKSLSERCFVVIRCTRRTNKKHFDKIGRECDTRFNAPKSYQRFHSARAQGVKCSHGFEDQSAD